MESVYLMFCAIFQGVRVGSTLTRVNGVEVGDLGHDEVILELVEAKWLVI